MKKALIILGVIVWSGAAFGTFSALGTNQKEIRGQYPCEVSWDACAIHIAIGLAWPATVAGMGAYKIVRSETK